MDDVLKASKDWRARRDLSHLAGPGAKTRRHRYWRDARAFIVPVLAAAAAQAAIYGPIFFRSGQANWHNVTLTLGALSAVPVFSVFVLTAFRRNEAPIVSAVAVVLVFFSFAVTALSALRIPVSYLGLASTLPAALAVMAFANIRFHRTTSGRVGLIAFTGASAIAELFREQPALIETPQDDIIQFDTVLIDPSQHLSEEWSQLLSRCYLSGIEILPWTRFLEIRMGRVDVPSFDLGHVFYSPSQLIYARAKRLLDLLAVLVTLPVTLPLVVLVAVYIFLRDGRPVLFVQPRYGFGGRIFRLYKFRTMFKGTGGGATAAGDKRIIPGCGLLRRTRMDEIPQLYNIFKGDMSLIGPRPEALDLVRWYRKEIPQWDYRTLVLPGITGWAQVSNGATSNPDEARTKLAYDLYYIKHLSFDLDLQILFRTVQTVLLGTGAR